LQCPSNKKKKKKDLAVHLCFVFLCLHHEDARAGSAVDKGIKSQNVSMWLRRKKNTQGINTWA